MASPTTAIEWRRILNALRKNGMTPDAALVDALRQQFGPDFDMEAEEVPPVQPEPKVPPVSTEQLPKQELLLKLLKMTTSSNDGEALTAIRKVNTLLTTNGWDWDKFVAGKIKIVENPFVGLGTPPRRDKQAPRPAPQSPPHQTTPPPPPKAKFFGQRARSIGINKFADHCYCCGIEVIAQAGGFFLPSDYNLNARSPNPKSKFAVICSSCDGAQIVWDQPAQPIRKKGKASVGDLA